MRKALLTALLGFALGVAAALGGRDLLAEHLDGGLDAEVIAERREPDRLVLVLRADDGTRLASFAQRIDDIAELVQVGDVVRLRAPRDGVFADDPPILSVRRGSDAAVPVPPPEPHPTDAGVPDAAVLDSGVADGPHEVALTNTTSPPPAVRTRARSSRGSAAP